MVKRYKTLEAYDHWNPRKGYEPEWVLASDFAALDSALRALGVCGEGYCFCATNRDPAKADHAGECVEARRALGEAT